MTPTDRHIVFIGLSGVGKSSIARAVARHLSWAHADTDELVRRATGESPSEIIRSQGVTAFRSLESAALHQAVSSTAPTVVATGGGIVEIPENRELLDSPLVVWLDASPEAIAARIASSIQDRPLLDGDPVAELATLSARRGPWYESLADIRVPTENRSVRQVVSAVVGALEEWK